MTSVPPPFEHPGPPPSRPELPEGAPEPVVPPPPRPVDALPPLGAYQLRTKVANPNGKFVFEGLTGKVGNTDFTGRIELDPDTPRAAPGGRNDDAPVARAEVDDVVLWCDLGHIEHFLDQHLRRGHPDDVLARLADLWFIRRLLSRLRERTGTEEARGKSKRNQPKGPTRHEHRYHSLT